MKIGNTQWIRVFPKINIPQNGWFILENPIKLDDLGVPLFSETSIHTYISLYLYTCIIYIYNIMSIDLTSKTSLYKADLHPQNSPM